MGNVDLNKVINVIYAAVITVPGVVGFAAANEPGTDRNSKLLLKDFDKSIIIVEDKKTVVVNLNLVLLESTNIKDIAQEVQIRVKYELEKLAEFPNDFLVNIIVKDLLVK